MWNFLQETGRWLFGGNARSDDASSPDGDDKPPPSDPEAAGLSAIDEVIRQLFRQQGVDARAEGEWIVLPEGRKLRSRIHQREPHLGVSTVQLDLLLELSPGRTLVESFAGVGNLPQAAVFDALENFRVGSMPVFLAAFCGDASDGADFEEWTIGGEQRRVILGPLGVRGEPPAEGSELAGAVRKWEEFVRRQEFRPEVHWLRLYYAQQGGQTLACEALLDNEVWPEAQEAAASIEWPGGEEFYSVRLFVVVQEVVR